MNDPINPWLDADEVRSLASRLMPPKRKEAPNTSALRYDDSSIGFDALPSPAIPAMPILSAPPVCASETPPIERPPAPSPVAQREFPPLQAWLEKNPSLQGFFITDSDGNVILGHNSHPRLHFIAQTLVTQPIRTRSNAKHVHLKIGPDLILNLIPYQTGNTTFVISVVLDKPLTNSEVDQTIQRLASSI